MSEHDFGHGPQDWQPDEPDLGDAGTADLGDPHGHDLTGDDHFGHDDPGDDAPGDADLDGGGLGDQPFGREHIAADLSHDYHSGDDDLPPEHDTEYDAAQPHDGLGQDPAPVGADPDLTPEPDGAGWADDPFPPALDLHTPQPVDGYPWTDPASLGAGDAPIPDPATPPADPPPVTDLFEYAGEEPAPDGADPWTALAASPDPATSTLARFWGTPPA